MSKFLFFAALSLVGLLCVSCQKEKDPTEGTGTLAINIEGLVGNTTTKAGYQTVQPYESVVRTLEILVFSPGASDATSYLELYHLCTASEISAMSATLSLKTGDKKVYVVSNGPKDGGGDLLAGKITTLAALKSIPIDLSDNVTTGEGAGFVAFGGRTVLASETSAAIGVARLASRVALRKVVCKLPSAYTAITIKRAWLANVVGNQNLDGSAAPATFYNRQSRADDVTQVSSEIIDGSGYAASCPALTYADLEQNIANGASYEPSTPLLFYAYANPSTLDPNGFSATYTEQKSALVLAVDVVGPGLYYYTIVLPDGLKTTATLGTNTAYTIDLVIAGLGEHDPNKPVSKTAVTADISLAPWVSQTPYIETI